MNPVVTSNDTMTFVPAVDGMVYYYYLKNNAVPDKEDFINFWNVGYGCGSLSVHAECSAEVSLKAGSYPYMAVCLYDGEKYYLPVVLCVDTGFTLEPELDTDYKVKYTADIEGVLYYYYTANEKLPAIDCLMDAWNTAVNKGQVSIQAEKSGNIYYDNTLQETPNIVLFIMNGEQCMRPYTLYVYNEIDIEYIFVEFYSGVSSDGYIMVTGTTESNSVLRTYKIGSYNGWKKGDYRYYPENTLDDSAFSNGVIYQVQNYDKIGDAYKVV
ncbi:MAG: hypothetical protein II979_00525, partial [Clostridia bacterium]|nr:hypothetical protein [Clostridia bacterium]